jgi:carbon storage regulator
MPRGLCVWQLSRMSRRYFTPFASAFYWPTSGADLSRRIVLSRRRGERILIGANIELQVVDIDKTRVRLAIDAPQEVPIYRHELFRRIQDEGGSEERHDACPGTRP